MDLNGYKCIKFSLWKSYSVFVRQNISQAAMTLKWRRKSPDTKSKMPGK